MKSQGWGAIVMINTMAVRQVPPLGEAGYAASKGALAVAAKYLAKELGPHKIRVNTVHMGWMWGAPVQGYVQWQGRRSRPACLRNRSRRRSRRIFHWGKFPLTMTVHAWRCSWSRTTPA